MNFPIVSLVSRKNPKLKLPALPICCMVLLQNIHGGWDWSRYFDDTTLIYHNSRIYYDHVKVVYLFSLSHCRLVFDLNMGCFYQKCLDPDCRSTGFRSSSMFNYLLSRLSTIQTHPYHIRMILYQFPFPFYF